ncbi:hypothetical protein Cgig2_024792 [Carnegiea gigantea]|uniref:HMG box domain-containing protein n=1 Tax=Carnegiea gigantea TaxID=171969 RepID=A0A9Q1QBQ3_9CARY|nr:hypothetical protein Cgig2_024792 [Carnegiea gigantea]
MKGGKSSAKGRNADSKLSVKKKPAKPPKDPNKPKRPPSAFFVFMEEFRAQYKEKHPNNKSVAAVGKAAGEKWKSMSDAVSITSSITCSSILSDFSPSSRCEFTDFWIYDRKLQEKAPYVEKAEKRKKDYEKVMHAYNKKQAEGAGDDDSDKSRSEVNDEEGSGEDEEEDDDE